MAARKIKIQVTHQACGMIDDGHKHEQGVSLALAHAFLHFIGAAAFLARGRIR